jgi:hypothetical protein
MTAGAAGYEFTQEQNQTFTRLVRNMARSGAVVVVASLILLAYHFVDFFGVSVGASGSVAVVYLDYAIWGLMSLLGVITGVLLVKATTAFKALITTEGNDLAHLMFGVTRLADILGLIFWTGVVGSLLLALSFILLVLYS